MKSMRITLLLILTIFAACTQIQKPDRNPIAGIWKLVAIDIDRGPNSNNDPLPGQVTPTNDPLPSQFIFTNKHYSIVWMPGKDPIKTFAIRWQPTDAEKLKRFAEVGVNTGTYELINGHIRAHPTVARMPEFMGGYITFAYQWSGNNLVLTFVDEYTFDGVPAPWLSKSSDRIRLTLARLED